MLTDAQGWGEGARVTPLREGSTGQPEVTTVREIIALPSSVSHKQSLTRGHDGEGESAGRTP